MKLKSNINISINIRRWLDTINTINRKAGSAELLLLYKIASNIKKKKNKCFGKVCFNF